MHVSVDPLALAEMREHAARVHPHEACGLLARMDGAPRDGASPATSWHLSRYRPMRNHAPDPRRTFAIDSIAVARFDAELRAEGLALGAVFHSHPDSAAAPSCEDRDAAWPELIQLILGNESILGGESILGAEGTLSAWRRSGESLQELELRQANAASITLERDIANP